MKKFKRLARWSIVPLSIMMLLGLALSGCGGSSSEEISDILQQSEDAGKSITSMRQNVELVYEHPTYGTGTVQSRMIEISGGNVHVTEVIFGTTVIEKILVNGKQYSKSYNENWVEEPVTLNSSSTTAETSQFTDIVSNSTSQKQLDNETVNGYDCVHLQFELSPQNVKNMVSQVAPEDLANNQGGTVDIWIAADSDYMIKSEGYFKNVTITELGEVNLKVIITRSSINQPISIVAPI